MTKAREKTSDPRLLIPGTLFWVFAVLSLVTKNEFVIGLTIALGVGTFVGFAALNISRTRARKKVNRRVWDEGIPATAIVRKAVTNGSLNNHPYVEMNLEVTLPGGVIRNAEVRQLISQIMVSRVQPGQTIDVKLDPNDPKVVVVDEELTPFGY